MSKKIYFTKMVASGNDFVIVEQRKYNSIRKPGPFAVEICDKKYGVGADGLLILEKSRKADIRMRIFNPDGSEPQMCGNGIRCAALYSVRRKKQETRGKIKIETKVGLIEAIVGENKAEVKVRMTEPKGIRLDLPIKIAKRGINANFINTGVPHVVIFVEGIDKIDVVDIGRQIRFYKIFQPAGTNVDFVQIIDDNNVKLRTYERGVEDETLACGTGAVASALIYATGNGQQATRIINVYTKGGEILRVEFNKINDKFKNIWLEGKARIVYTGVYYV
jgi:diaminopimelate epimerase